MTENRASGGYRVFSLLDEEGPHPEAGQFYMLAAERHWERARRPSLPAAGPLRRRRRSRRARVRLDFLLEASAPAPSGSARSRLARGSGSTARSATPSRSPRELAPGAAGAILVGGGIGVAPLALLRRRFAEPGGPGPDPARLPRPSPLGGLDDLFSNCQIGLASDDGHLGERGYVTDLLAAMLEGDDAASAAVYACGPPAMLEAVRAMCAERGVACELALESPMACGFGACFGCAVPLAEGGYMRLCVDGPVVGAGRTRKRVSEAAGCDERERRQSTLRLISAGSRSSTR